MKSLISSRFFPILVVGSFFSHAFASSGSSAPLDANIFVNLAKKIVPSVVNISTLSKIVKSPYDRGGDDDLFRKFFENLFRQQHEGRERPSQQEPEEEDQDEMNPGMPGQNPGARAMSLGTGFIIDASGLILTNNHVVADADEIKINFTEAVDEKPTDGEVVGRDLELDLALIKVKTKHELIPAVLGDSNALEVGEYVIAVGNPFGQGHSVTHGIISAKERKAPDFQLANYLQTDAPINPGNSGGPLVNLKGEVIGINNAIDQRAQGIGFAIPISLVKKVLPQLRTKGTVSRGYIGVLVNELSPEIAQKIGAPKDLKAPFVTHVYPGDPADKAGLKPYDVILEFNKTKITSSGELVLAVTSVPVDEFAPIKVLRAGKEMNLSIKVSQRPGNQLNDHPEEKPSKKKKKTQHRNIGMELEDLTPEIAHDLGIIGKMTGAVVLKVAYGSPADKAGLMRGDVILEVERKSIKGADSFFESIKEKKSYLLRVRRSDPQGREMFSVVVLDLK